MRVFRKITMRLSSLPASFRVCIQTLKIVLFGTFPGAPAVQTLHAHCRRHEFNPQSRNKDTVQHTQIFLFPMKCQGIIITKKKKRKQEKKESSLCPGRGLSVSQQRPRLEQSGTHFQKYILYCSYPHYAREPRDSQLGGHLYREQKSCCSVEARMIQRKSFGAPSLFPDM